MRQSKGRLSYGDRDAESKFGSLRIRRSLSVVSDGNPIRKRINCSVDARDWGTANNSLLVIK